MKILFLHTNFPGQFKHICKHFAELNHDVRFLCNTHYGRKIKKVKKFKIKDPIENQNNKSDNALDHGKKTNMPISEQFRQAFLNFNQENWIPDVVISHSGWGCGMHVKEIWPGTRLISYLEWWFNPRSETYTYDQKNIYLGISQGSIHKHWIRNANISLELSTADKIVAPSKWQRNQLPPIFRNNCDVIFDGIDLEMFRLIEKKEDKGISPILTYGTRGMEPMRGFPQFIKSLPGILNAIPHLEIQIAGEDEINYGGKKAPGNSSWKNWAIDYLKDRKIEHKVKWCGRMPLDVYIKWLQKSWCHVYLTHPFVPSWSLAEAICCGCNIICSDIQATREYLIAENDLIFVDHRKVPNIEKEVVKLLAGRKERPKIFRKCLSRLSKDASCHAWSDVAGLNVTTQA